MLISGSNSDCRDRSVEHCKTLDKGIRLVKHGVDGRDAVFFSRRSWLGSSSPSAGCQFGDAADRQIGETRQDRAEIIADGDLQARAGFDDGEDGCDARTGFSASEVVPDFATKYYCPNGVLGRISNQLH